MEEAAAATAVRKSAGSPPVPGESGGDKTRPQERKVYMDYNATTPLEPDVIQAITEALQEAWGNPSSPYLPGRKAKEIINAARENLAKMVGGKPQDLIFTSGGTEANNLVIHSSVKLFQESQQGRQDGPAEQPPGLGHGAKPHIVTCSVEHDSIRLPLEHLAREHVAEVTFVPVSKLNGQAEADDVLAAIRPSTCLVTIMLANNETGVIMPVSDICRRIKTLNQSRAASGLPVIRVHTDAAQALGKRRVDVQELGVDYLTIVGHKFYGPRIGALYVRGLGVVTPLRPMLFGGGQEWSFRPGTENTAMIAGLGKAVFEKRIHLNSHFAGSDRLSNTCNFSIAGPHLQGRLVLARCGTLLASVGAACHSDQGDLPSPILLSCGIPLDVARNAIRLSVGRTTTREDVELAVEDLRQAVTQLEKGSAS
uniref:Selenocysteine lyase n=1 Tax=Monodelphis domestica TaxID=13616 RepID=A0A5F8H869_MONDO